MAALEAVLRRDRLVVAASLVAIGLLSWLYLINLAADMAAMNQAPTADAMSDTPGMDMSGMDMPADASESESTSAASSFVFLAGMWMVMMVGMMLPSAAPTILLFAALERKRLEGMPYGRTALFVAGYFLVWAAFSILAASAQAVLSRTGFLSMDMAVTSGILGGVVFVLAGLYELTPLKQRCLTHCRSPLEWLPRHLRPGRLGALVTGGEHGAYCVGCCWMLMLLLFVGGVMNLLWVAAIAAVVLVEKLFPRGMLSARLAGAVLVIAGIALIARPLLVA
jgi:predicted metal-binding membrane protein